MTIGAKILAALAGLCFLAWGIAFSFGIQPLFRDRGIEVIYGEHEEFQDNGMAYRKFRNPGLVLVHIPGAPPERRWWTVDFRNLIIAKVAPPRSIGGSYFVMKGDLAGSAIGGLGNTDTWLWRFTGDTASFASRSFTCRVRRSTGN